jgi:hypothetical protein
MGLSTWFKKTKAKVKAWFAKPEDQAIIEFFGPLIDQVKAAALKAGQDNLQVGLNILKEAALAAVLEAQTSGSGNKVKAAEKVFLEIVKTKGIDAIENAEAGLIKAAVAIIQGATGAVAAPSDLTPKDQV